MFFQFNYHDVDMFITGFDSPMLNKDQNGLFS